MHSLQIRRYQIRIALRHLQRGMLPRLLQMEYGRRADGLKRHFLTGEWQESAGIKGKLLSIGYGLATISRAAAQLTLTGEMQQDKRGRLTFWRTMPLLTRA